MIKTGKALAEAARNVAENYKTLYVLGCIGAPLNSANKIRYTRNLRYNARGDRAQKIRAASADTFGFDCVCLIKSLLWGWEGDTSKVYGGASYGSNGVPDWDANYMIKKCSGVTTTGWEHLMVGEALWMPDHIGIYVGDGMAVECTARWKDGVQITAVHNIGPIDGMNGRTWQKHGALPWLSYDTNPDTTPAPAEKPAAKLHELPSIAYGSRGATAKALQILLAGNGQSCGKSGADGIFGAASCTALKNYQKANSLYPDGICGPATWAKIMGMG